MRGSLKTFFLADLFLSSEPAVSVLSGRRGGVVLPRLLFWGELLPGKGSGN